MKAVTGVGGVGAQVERDSDEGGTRFHDVDAPASGRWPVEAASVAATGKLVNHGGDVLEHVNVTAVYLGNYWQNGEGDGIRTHNDAALADLVKNKDVTGIWAQYGVGQGSTNASMELAMANPKRMTQAQVEALVKKEVLSGKFDTSNPERVFDLVLPPGCELIAGDGSTSHDGLGGFHGSVKVGGHEVYYAAIANPERTAAGPNSIDFDGNVADGLSIIESHEVTEAVTDPNVEVAERNNDRSQLAWYDDVTRWDGGKGKGEIGDIPILNAELAGDRSLKTTWGRTDGFAFQKEWSNKDGKAELGPTK